MAHLCMNVACAYVLIVCMRMGGLKVSHIPACTNSRGMHIFVAPSAVRTAHAEFVGARLHVCLLMMMPIFSLHVAVVVSNDATTTSHTLILP